jgi:CBS domain-containing protein
MPSHPQPQQTGAARSTARDAMAPPGPQVADDMTVDIALSVLISARVEHLLVHDEDGRCAGLVTRAQLIAHRGGAWYREQTRLREIFHNRGPFTLGAAPVREADSAMRDRMLGASPVVDEDGYALGILAFTR